MERCQGLPPQLFPPSWNEPPPAAPAHAGYETLQGRVPYLNPPLARPHREILAGMKLVAEIHARLVEGLEDRQPSPSQLGEGFGDQACRPLGPWIKERPGERAGEGGMRLETKPLAGLCRP